jgi:hypothetical protein
MARREIKSSSRRRTSDSSSEIIISFIELNCFLLNFAIIYKEVAEVKEEASVEKEVTKQQDSKSHKKVKDSKTTSGKETKMDNKHKKETNKKDKGKLTIEEQTQEENFSPDFPETVAFACFTDLPLNKLSVSTELVKMPNQL